MILNERASKLEEIYQKESHSVTPTAVKRPRTPYSELAENMKVLNFINTKWSNKVKGKEKEISQYKENIKELEDALEIMKNIVSSNSTTEAVKSFIDSCEHEKDLNTSFLHLSEKIETIEKNISKTRKMIKKISEESNNRNLEERNKIEKIEKELLKVKSEEHRLISNKEKTEKIIANSSPVILNFILIPI